MNNLIKRENCEIEAIKIYNKFKECMKNPNNAYKFFGYIDSLNLDRMKYSQEEIILIRNLVIRNIAIDYSTMMINGGK